MKAIDMKTLEDAMKAFKKQERKDAKEINRFYARALGRKRDVHVSNKIKQ